MELKDFIAQTLTQICQGVHEARSNTSQLKTVIAPRTNENGVTLMDQTSTRLAQKIHFEVLLVNQEDAGSSGGVKVAAGFFSMGGQTQNGESFSHTHKVCFDVPLVWPELPPEN